MATALKLGELLVQEKVITPHQLEEALKYQVIFGGKLGTNLIELDFVREDDIAKTLSKMLRVPLVSGEELNDIPQDVIDLIPRDMAEQYQAIPLQLDNRKLTLVMANPADLKAIDEIAFRTGFIVRPAVAPEVRLILALENHYHIPREIRYVQVSKKVEGLLNETEVTAPAKKKAAPAPPKAAPAPPKAAPAPPKAAPAPPKAAPAPPKAAPAPPKAAPAPPEVIPEPVKEEKVPTKIEFDEPSATPTPAPVAADPKPAKKEPVVVKEASEDVMELMEADIVEESTENVDSLQIPDVFKHLADPSDREDIAESVASFVGHDADRCAIFQIRGDIAQGWRLVSNRKEDPNFGEFQVTLDHPSILKTVTDTASYYIGPIPTTSKDNIRLVEALGGTPPTTALLVPVIVMSRVITVLYVDDKKGDLAEKLLELQKLAAKMAMAFEILILKNKILMM